MHGDGGYTLNLVPKMVEHLMAHNNIHGIEALSSLVGVNSKTLGSAVKGNPTTNKVVSHIARAFGVPPQSICVWKETSVRKVAS